MREKTSRKPFWVAATQGLLFLAIPTIAACGGGTRESDPNPSSTSSTSATSSTGGGVPDAPKSYAASDPCTVFPQAGCPDDHTCVVASADGATTCESAGSAPRSGQCSVGSDCAPGLSCVGSTCRPFCQKPSDCGGKAPACLPISIDSKPVLHWSLCSLPCNPADPRNLAGAAGLFACPSGMGCSSLDPTVGPSGSTDCYPAGPGKDGSVCANGSDCGPGLVCLTDSGASSCRPMCLKGMSNCDCLSFAEPQYAATATDILEVGYCQ